MWCKKILFAFIIVVISYIYVPAKVSADSSGPNSPGTVADNAATGIVPWINPENAAVSDNIYASADLSGTTTKSTHYLALTNFGFSIPIGATINGITVEIEKKRIGGTKDTAVKIIKGNGSIGTINKAIDTAWPLSDGYITYGGVGDLWGETWTAENINNSNFGVALSAGVTVYAAPCLNEYSRISTLAGYKQIRNIVPGDIVLTYNDKYDLFEYKKVLDIWSTPITAAQNTYVNVSYDGDKSILATKNHQFFVDGVYKEAGSLRIGDRLFASNGLYYPVDDIELISNAEDQVWDLTVEDNHNFFVNDILVHNSESFAYVDNVRITVNYTDTSPTSTPTPTPAPAVSETPSTTNSSPPNPNDHTHDWNYVKPVSAGPNFTGTPQFLGDPSIAQTLIMNTTHHDDVNLSVQTPPIENLVAGNIPLPIAQGLNTAGNITQFTTVAAFNGYPIHELDHPAIVQIAYDPTKLSGHSPKDLRIAYFDSKTKKWIVLKNNTVFDIKQNKLANTTKYFNTYYTVVYPSETGIGAATFSVQGAQTESLPSPTPVTPIIGSQQPVAQPVIQPNLLSRIRALTRMVASWIVSPFVTR